MMSTGEIRLSAMNRLSGQRRTVALMTLAMSVFVIGTAELLPMGLLLPISSDTGVTVPAAGMLVTAYALGVVFGGPLLSALTGSVPRKPLMGLLLGLFIAGGALCAFSSSYAMLMAGRIVSSLAHGTLFGAMVVAAKDLGRPGKEGASIALVGSGLSVAVILGAPLGTLIGQQFGWRAPFLVITLLAAASLLLLLKFIPALPQAEDRPLFSQIRTVSSPAFLLVLLMTVFGNGGTFAAFTYIAPILEQITGFSGEAVSSLLLLFGIGSAIGNLLGGRLADKHLAAVLLGGMSLLAVSMAVFTWTSHNQTAAVLTILIWGAAAYMIMTPLNVRVLQKAGDAQGLASALNISAFNLGNALGAFVGGMVIHSKLGLPAVPWTASLVTAIGILLTLWSLQLDRRGAA